MQFTKTEKLKFNLQSEIIKHMKNQGGRDNVNSATPKNRPFGLKMIMDLFDVSPRVALATLGTTALILIMAGAYFIHLAPPSAITMTSGPEGSVFQKNALKYAKILERNGVKLKVLTSEGSMENLQRLSDPKSHVDFGFVQAGITDAPPDRLVSLGSIAYQPVLIFYRGKTIELLSELSHRKISAGPVGSGTHKFALALLAANGIEDNARLLHLEATEAAKKLTDGEIDAAFIMSESASSDILKSLLRSETVHLFNFKQANAYSRKIDYLNVLDLPEGAIDFGLDIPPHDVTLVGPMVELIATNKLHPALSDLVIEAAVATHGRPGIFQHRGEFPAPLEHGIPVSDDANRFYKSGKSLFFRYLPFWLASLISRIVVVFLPVLVVLIPTLRSIPAFFRWRTQSKIYQRYRELLILENRIVREKNTSELEALRARFDHIQDSVNRMKIPAAFADQFYGLRGHIDYVRSLVENRKV
jgi:hypothetical protein